MKTIDMKRRLQAFEEVKLGLTEDEALAEASRCLQCPVPQCSRGCPVGIDIKAFIARIREKDYDGASEIIRKDNSLPAICGRVCPQENQCEGSCPMKIHIGDLERFIADRTEPKVTRPNLDKRKAAIVGSGPGGLTCARDLMMKGFQVTIFEALHAAGGVLRYGIPEFRLPKEIIDKEIKALEDLGIDIRLNQVVGKTISLEQVEKDHDAVFIANGAGLPVFLDMPGEDLKHVYSANEFLVRNNLMKAYRDDHRTPIRKAVKAVVIGGGNVAVDAARVARRLGSEVTIAYRRTREEMPARVEEIEHALEEGIVLQELASPV